MEQSVEGSGWEPTRGSGGSTRTMRHIDCSTMPVVGVSGSRVGPSIGRSIDTVLLWSLSSTLSCHRGRGCRRSASIGTVAAVVVATTGPAMAGHQRRLVAHAACSSGLHRGCAICLIGLVAVVDSARGSGFICRMPAAVITAVVCCVVVVRLISAGYNMHSPAELSEQFRTTRANVHQPRQQQDGALRQRSPNPNEPTTRCHPTNAPPMQVRLCPLQMRRRQHPTPATNNDKAAMTTRRHFSGDGSGSCSDNNDGDSDDTTDNDGDTTDNDSDTTGDNSDDTAVVMQRWQGAAGQAMTTQWAW
ncbi:hypothetical protein EDB85DRAFT_1891011 [Lactarius pseudohatsudake]|nr:hypothetical protein EDB85DRAFT_1891011 [Lactarius pseudohatsudake]